MAMSRNARLAHSSNSHQSHAAKSQSACLPLESQLSQSNQQNLSSSQGAQSLSDSSCPSQTPTQQLSQSSVLAPRHSMLHNAGTLDLYSGNDLQLESSVESVAAASRDKVAQGTVISESAASSAAVDSKLSMDASSLSASSSSKAVEISGVASSSGGTASLSTQDVATWKSSSSAVAVVAGDAAQVALRDVKVTGGAASSSQASAMVGSRTTFKPHRDKGFAKAHARVRVDVMNGSSNQDVLRSKQHPRTQLHTLEASGEFRPQFNVASDAASEAARMAALHSLHSEYGDAHKVKSSEFEPESMQLNAVQVKLPQFEQALQIVSGESLDTDAVHPVAQGCEANVLDPSKAKLLSERCGGASSVVLPVAPTQASLELGGEIVNEFVKPEKLSAGVGAVFEHMPARAPSSDKVVATLKTSERASQDQADTAAKSTRSKSASSASAKSMTAAALDVPSSQAKLVAKKASTPKTKASSKGTKASISTTADKASSDHKAPDNAQMVAQSSKRKIKQAAASSSSATRKSTAAKAIVADVSLAQSEAESASSIEAPYSTVTNAHTTVSTAHTTVTTAAGNLGDNRLTEIVMGDSMFKLSASEADSSGAGVALEVSSALGAGAESAEIVKGSGFGTGYVATNTAASGAVNSQEYRSEWVQRQNMWQNAGKYNPLSGAVENKHSSWPMFGWEQMRPSQRVTYLDVEPRYLELLSSKYPNRVAAFSEIINLQAILNLPKGTEHFVSDIHGEYEAFKHILNNCSGVIREKVDLLFPSLSTEQRDELCTLIYYPREVLKELESKGQLTDGWYRTVLLRLIQLCKYLSAKYTRSKVRKAINKDYAYIIDELLHAQEGESNARVEYHSKIIDTILHIHAAHHFVSSLCALSKRLAVDHLHVVGDIYDRGPHPDQVMALLMDYHSLDIQWGNHDILWMGAACGSEACMATVLRNNINYFNCNLLESSYGISLRKLNDFAERTYHTPVKECSTKLKAQSLASASDSTVTTTSKVPASGALDGFPARSVKFVGTVWGDDVSPEDQIQFIQLSLGYSENKLNALTTHQLKLVYQYALEQMEEQTLSQAAVQNTTLSAASSDSTALDSATSSSATSNSASGSQAASYGNVAAEGGASITLGASEIVYTGNAAVSDFSSSLDSANANEACSQLGSSYAGKKGLPGGSQAWGEIFTQYGGDAQHATAQALLAETAARSQLRQAKLKQSASTQIAVVSDDPHCGKGLGGSQMLAGLDPEGRLESAFTQMERAHTASLESDAATTTLAARTSPTKHNKHGAASDLALSGQMGTLELEAPTELAVGKDKSKSKDKDLDKKFRKGKKLKALVKKLEAEYAERMQNCSCIVPEVGGENLDVDASQARKDKMVKAITVIALKLQGQLILRNPEFNMDDRLLLDKIDLKRGKVTIGDQVYDLNTVDLPTLDPDHPFELSPEEAEVVKSLKYSFMHSRELQREVGFLFSHGSIYKRFNGNLLYHGCIPMTSDGQFKKINCHGKMLSGKVFLDYCEAVARRAFDEHDEQSLDFMYFLWCGINSPLSGRIMKPFERYFIDDKSSHVEPRDPYYSFYYQEEICRKVLTEFNLDPDTGHIINGHTPIKVKQGESPIRGNGKLFVIDGGLCTAYHETTGIAGYTLIFSSHGMVLQAHRPFVSTEEAIAKRLDIVSVSQEVEHYTRRLHVADSDTGIKLKRAIFELEALLDAYRQGILPES